MSRVANIFEGPRTYRVDDADSVTQLHLVKLNAAFDGVENSGATDDVVGIALSTIDTAANGRIHDRVAVQPLDKSVPVRLVASAAISAGDKLEKAAGGRVATASAGEEIGYIAMDDATAAGDVIEAVPFV